MPMDMNMKLLLSLKKFFSKNIYSGLLETCTALPATKSYSQTQTRRKHTVIIEGNIGCGKSTFLEHFNTHPTVEAIQEPVDNWTNVAGYNLLNMLYTDPKRWSFSFNNYAMLTRVMMHQHQTTKPIKMLERSLFSTRHIFVENSLNQGHLNRFEYSILDKWYHELTATTPPTVDLYVYLRATPEICHERILKRNRSEEATVSLELLRNLNQLYENAFNVDIHKESNTPVLILNADQDLHKMEQLYEDYRPTILCGCS